MSYYCTFIFMNEQKINNFINNLRRYYWDNWVIPTLENMKDIVGFASRDSVRRYYDFIIELGYLKKEGKKYFPTDSLLTFPLFGSVKAGNPTDTEADNVIDMIDINKYLVWANPNTVVLVRVSWDSMLDASIQDGDIVIVDINRINPNFWDIVVASVDGESEFTLKRYMKDEEHKPYLQYENQTDYPDKRIYPQESMKIFGTVNGLFRKL